MVEVDESHVGGKARNAKRGKPPPKKHAVFTLVEREARSLHVTNVNARTPRPILARNADRKSALMTDDSAIHPKLGREFSYHGTVNHGAGEYMRGIWWYTNTV